MDILNYVMQLTTKDYCDCMNRIMRLLQQNVNISCNKNRLHSTNVVKSASYVK